MSDNPFSDPSVRAPSPAPVAARFSQRSVADTVRELDTDPLRGLSSGQISLRRALHGVNELSGDEEESLVSKFAANFYGDPLILLLIGSAAVSFWMGNVEDAVSITLAIFIVVTVGFVQEYRSEKSLEALTKLVPAEAKLTREGNTSTVLASTLVPGDLVHVSQGDRVPADLRLTDAVHLQIDESNLTGEGQPMEKESEASHPGQSTIAFMGTLVRDGHGSGIVVATAKQTQFGAVFEMMNSIEKPKTPLQQAMDKLGKDLSVFSFVVIAVICLIGVVQGRSWLEMFQISVSLAVAAIPEGLPIIVTVTLALGVLRMAKSRAIVKRLPSVETLGSVNVICSDKTGTLTQNHMTVTKLWTADYAGSFGGVFLEVDRLAGDKLASQLTPNARKLLECANLCNNSRFSSETEKFIGNPSDVALVEVLRHFGLEDVRGTRHRVAEHPFSSRTKYMAVSVHSGDTAKSEVLCKGAIEKVVEMSGRYLDARGEIKPLTEEVRSQVLGHADAMAAEGLRVLGFARGSGALDAPVSGAAAAPKNLVLCGLCGMNDPPRPNVHQSIALLMKGGVHVVMITGDSPTTAVNIARQIGMPCHSDSAVMTGAQLETLGVEALADAIHNVSIFARTTPENKVTIVKAFQRRGDIVAMTGDGVNDAPALKLADIGIAMGKQGTDVAKEAADMVLTDDDFSTILGAIEEGKGIFANIRNFIAFQLSTSIAALSLIALSTFFGLPNPLNAMQILWINIIMDGPPAQSLGVEPVDHEVMLKPPRRRDDKILTPAVVKRVLQSAAMIIVGTMYVYIREMNEDNDVTKRDTTMTFTCFVLFDMFNALSCRHQTKSIFEVGFTNNQMFNLAVGGSLLGQVCAIYVPFFQRVFQTEALSLGDLCYLVAVTSTVFLLDEARKWWSRGKRTQGYSYV
ncbi:Calcium-transporting ATPase [[Candida] zeylanoides]